MSSSSSARLLASIASMLAPPLCWSCSAVARSEEPLCLSCRGRLRFLGPEPVVLAGLPTWAPVAYEGPARDLVGALKFHAALAIAEAMAAIMFAGRALPANAVLVPVPLTLARQRRRGFNQATVLGGALARRTGLPLEACLGRSGRAPPQVGRGRGARLAGPAGSIHALRPPPAYALLVDDVVTTGATLVACATALRAAGPNRVEAIAFARTMGR